jgi:hypothetical protein
MGTNRSLINSDPDSGSSCEPKSLHPVLEGGEEDEDHEQDENGEDEGFGHGGRKLRTES